MKTTAIISMILATSQAAVGTDCKSAASACDASTECCGVASKDSTYKNGQTDNWAKDGVTRTVCNTKAATTWIEDITVKNADLYRDPNQSSGKAGYTFKCNVEAKKTGASSLIATTAAILAAAVYMA